MTQKCNELKNIAIIRIKKSVSKIFVLFMTKREAKELIVNSNLTNKKGILYIFFYFIKLDNTTYYQRNREIMLNRAND